MQDLRKNLESLISKLGLSQKDFSDKIGISPSAINQYLKGQSKSLNSETILQVINIYGVNPTWLLTGEGEMFLSQEPIRKDEPETPPRKINHLTAHDGNVKEYPDIDDSDQIARTAWYRALPDVNQWIINAMDELRNDEDLEKIKKMLNALVLKQRADKEFNEELLKVYEKIKEKENALRKKGEAG